MKITSATIAALQRACAEIGESRVTVATEAGVISFEFEPEPGPSACRILPFESQPSRTELAAILP